MSTPRQQGKTASGPRALGDVARPLLSPALRRQGFAQHEIVTKWSSIVGPLLGARSLPERLKFPQGARRGGTLFVRVHSAFALEFQHLTTQILERVNTYYGYSAVEKLVIRQAPLPMPPQRKRDSAAELTAEAEKDLNASLETMKPGPVRDSLTRLGRRILADRAD